MRGCGKMNVFVYYKRSDHAAKGQVARAAIARPRAGRPRAPRRRRRAGNLFYYNNTAHDAPIQRRALSRDWPCEARETLPGAGPVFAPLRDPAHMTTTTTATEARLPRANPRAANGCAPALLADRAVPCQRPQAGDESVRASSERHAKKPPPLPRTTQHREQWFRRHAPTHTHTHTNTHTQTHTHAHTPPAWSFSTRNIQRSWQDAAAKPSTVPQAA